MNFILWRSKQTVFEVSAYVVGLLLFLVISFCVHRGSAITSGVAMVTTFVMFTLTFVVLAHLFEADENGKVRMLTSVRRQSWTFLFGGLLMPFIVLTAAAAWETPDMMPGYTQTAWWPVAGFVGGLLFGYVWRRIDNARYHDLGLWSMLMSPTKWWIDYVQMPMGAALVLTWCFPPLAGPGNYSVGLATLLTVLGLLVIADAFRKLNPRDQHIQWDPRRFKPA